jgi:hypothetical protein
VKLGKLRPMPSNPVSEWIAALAKQYRQIGNQRLRYAQDLGQLGPAAVADRHALIADIHYRHANELEALLADLAREPQGRIVPCAPDCTICLEAVKAELGRAGGGALPDEQGSMQDRAYKLLERLAVVEHYKQMPGTHCGVRFEDCHHPDCAFVRLLIPPSVSPQEPGQ